MRHDQADGRMRRPIDQLGIQRRERIMQFIFSYGLAHQRSPTLTEIADAVGLRQAHTVSMHLHRLCGEGLVDFQVGKRRSVRLTRLGLEQLQAEAQPGP